MPPFLKRVASFLGLRKNRATFGIQSVEEFQLTLYRERTRTDRTGNGFSVVVFETGNLETGSMMAHFLIQTLTGRIRSADAIGWFDESRIGIFLPNTTADGAGNLAREICSMMATQKFPPPWEIYTYPTEWFTPSDSDSVSDHFVEPVSSTSKMNVETMEEVRKNNPTSTATVFRPKKQFGRISLWKRAFDIMAALFCLALLSPLFIVIAILIKIVSADPIFFKQERIGYLGQPFTMWKFRTIKESACIEHHQRHLCELIESDKIMEKLEYGDQIIPFGKLLRSWCLDELPQLFNVLMGQMSLIGPRPAIAYEVEQYAAWCKQRFDVVPGMTGLWQVSGKNRLTFKEMVRLDIRYASKRSLRLDLKILFLTPFAIFTQVLDNLKRKISQLGGVRDHV